MKFFDATDKQGLLDDIDFLVGSTSASFPILDKLRCVNNAYNQVAALIWDSDGTWQYDDSNATDSPKAIRTLGQASASYQVPTTARRIEGVEVKTSAGEWRKMAPIDYHDLNKSPEEYLKTSGMPRFYGLTGNEIRLFPPPNSAYATLASGMTVRISRNVTEFTSASSASPGFATSFHRILSLAAAIDFEKEPQALSRLVLMKDRLEKGLVKFYSKRGVEMKTRIKPYLKRRYRQWL